MKLGTQRGQCGQSSQRREFHRGKESSGDVRKSSPSVLTHLHLRANEVSQPLPVARQLGCFFDIFFSFFFFFCGIQKKQDGPSHSPWAGLELCLFSTKMEGQAFKRAFLFFLSLLHPNFISCKCNMAACPEPSGSSCQVPPASQPRSLDPWG